LAVNGGAEHAATLKARVVVIVSLIYSYSRWR